MPMSSSSSSSLVLNMQFPDSDYVQNESSQGKPKNKGERLQGDGDFQHSQSLLQGPERKKARKGDK